MDQPESTGFPFFFGFNEGGKMRRFWAAIGLTLITGCAEAGREAATESIEGAPELSGELVPGNAPSGFSPTGEWVVTPMQVGPVEIGVALSETLPLLRPEEGVAQRSDLCEQVTPRDAPEGLTLMVEGGKVVRADVRSGATATLEGARIGDPEERILELYPSTLRRPHKYTDGSYLIVNPLAPEDTIPRYLFETDGEVVTMYRAGLYPQVEYVEGCL